MPELHAQRSSSGNRPIPSILTAMGSAGINGSMDWLEESFKENEKDENADETWMEMVRIKGQGASATKRTC